MRIQKSFTQGSTTTTNYLYDGYNLLEEIDGSGNLLARYTQTTKVDEPLFELRSGTTSYYEQDALGSVSSLSDASGALANTYSYDSFGKLLSSSGTLTNPFRYTGREFDPETGVYEYRARYYDQTVGRFASEDPLRFSAGANFYSYVHNNPVDLTDPLGLCDKVCIPRSLLPWSVQALLAVMSFASQTSGVTYFVGVQGSGTATGGGYMGATAGGSAVYATDPQGNQALVVSTSAAATMGTPGVGGGLQIGGATYPNVSGFGGPSYGWEASGGVGLVPGFGTASNASGVATYANVSLALGHNVNWSPSAVSNGNIVIMICPK